MLGAVPGRVGRRSPRTGRFISLGLVIYPRVTLDELGTHAGSIAYGALFSIPPLVLLALSATDLLVRRSDQVEVWLYEHLLDLVPGLESLLQIDSSDITAHYAFGLVGLATLLWAATGLASRVRHGLGIVHRTAVSGLTVGHADGFVAQIPLGLGLLALLAAAGGLAVLAGRGIIGSMLHTLGYVVIVALGVLFWTAAYWLLTPRRRMGYWGFLPGGAFYAVAFALLQRLGTWYYVYISSRYADLYGAIGNFLGILAIVYIMAWALLFGAEINQALHESRQRSGRSADRGSAG